LQSRALLGRRNRDDKADNLALWHRFGQGDAQWGAIWLDAISNLELGGLAINLDL
jgi:hypothetical protein